MTTHSAIQATPDGKTDRSAVRRFVGRARRKIRTVTTAATRKAARWGTLSHTAWRRQRRVDAIRRAQRTGDRRRALVLARVAVRYSPTDPTTVLIASELCMEWGEPAEALRALSRLPKRVQRWKVTRLQRVSAYEHSERFDLAERELRAAVEAFPDDRQLASHLVDRLGIWARFDDADTALHELSSAFPDVPTSAAQYSLAIAKSLHEDAYDIAVANAAENPGSLVWRNNLCHIVQYLYRTDTTQPDRWKAEFRDAVDLLRQSYDDDPKPQLLGRILNYAIRLDDVDLVSQTLDLVEADNRTRPVLNARMFLARRAGASAAELRTMWSEVERKNHIPQLRELRPGELSEVSTRPVPPSSDEIRVFTVVRDERWRLAWFLDYYRRLGVDRFFFVDNDSSDGTAEYLSTQSDVHLFFTDATYASGRSGVVWLNNLMTTYGQNSWNMYVDVDEALVVPHMEDGADLPHVTRYLERHGFEALRGHMIDMYSDSPVRLVDGEERDFVAHYPWFDNVYIARSSPSAPYTTVTGGVRRLFGVAPEMTKTPLIKGGRNIRLLSSSHQVTPAHVADISCALLHYKMAGDFAKTARSDAEVNSRRIACMRRHVHYAAALSSLGDDHPDLRNESTVRYESSDTLERAGRLESSPDFWPKESQLEGHT